MDIETIRAENVKWLSKQGFKAASSLPVKREAIVQVRPVEDIASRLMALEAVFTWVSAAEEDVEGAKLRDYVKRNQLTRWMTASEQKILGQERSAAHEAHADAIGWRLENMWALAWVLGFELEPPLDGKMIEVDITQQILFEFLPGPSGTVDEFVEDAEVRPLEEVVRLEDRFYCCHNAVRSAQLGGKTVPKGFHPVANGGVIHERRHALTWCLSPGTGWDDTDLST